MDEMFAIKCQNCGGPMYSHQAKRSFECAYCGTVVPWQADAGEPKSALGIRHTPLTVVDGLLKLTHVSQLERPQDPDWYFFNAHWRNQSVLEHLLWEDRGTAQEFQEATHVSIPCPFCGASFEGESTQRVFECPSCGNKIGIADLLKPGTFSKRLTMGVGAEYVPEQGIPCEISPQQARANALQLVRQYPDAFAGHDVEDAIQNDMMLFYFPMALADLRMMASFPGKGLSKEALVYYEVLDWAYPGQTTWTFASWAFWSRGTLPRSVRSIPPCRKVTFALSQSMRLPRTRWSLISWRSTLRATTPRLYWGSIKRAFACGRARPANIRTAW